MTFFDKSNQERFSDIVDTSLTGRILNDYINILNKRIVALEERLSEPSIVRGLDNEAPTLEKPVSQSATYSQLTNEIYFEWCNRIRMFPFPHRKPWEFVFILRHLELSGFLKQGMSGLGFGCGKDPIIAYMAKCGVKVLATDLGLSDAELAGWADSNQHAQSIRDLNSMGVCTNEELVRNVKFLECDMNNIPDSIGEFDFVWSACALEHLGSIEKGITFIKNSLKLLKPGGIAVHTTELNLSSDEDTIFDGPTVLFRMRDFQALQAELNKDGYQMDLNFNFGDSCFDSFVDVPPYNSLVHHRLKLCKYVTTSFGLAIKKL